MIQTQNQYPEPGTQMSPVTGMYPIFIQNGVSHSSPVFNQPQFHHQFPTTMNEQSSPVSSLSLPIMVASCPNPNNANTISSSASTSSTDESLSNVSSFRAAIPTIQTTQMQLTPALMPHFNPHGVTISPLSTGLCSPTVVSMDNVQTAWIAPGGNCLSYAPQTQFYSPSPQFVPFAQPIFTTTPPPVMPFHHHEATTTTTFPSNPSPPPMSYEATFGCPCPTGSSYPQHEPIPQNYPNNNVQQHHHSHFSSPQTNPNTEPSPPRSNHQFQQYCHNNVPEENVKKSPTRFGSRRNGKNGNCVPVSVGRNRKNFRVRCKACSAPVSRQVVKEVKQEDLESAFADQNEILDQLPEFFGEPLLNFPEIVFYMQIFKAQSKPNQELQYFKVPRPAKERELHIDHRLTELFIRNFGFDHACEHHEFKRLPMHVPGICHARNLYRQLIVDSLLPTFLAYVRNMEEVKRLFGIIFRFVGCATPKDIASNLPQVWKAVTDVDSDTSLEITGIVSLYNYHLFRRLIEKEEETN